jgi:lysophospholipase L1-like esterase
MEGATTSPIITALSPLRCAVRLSTVLLAGVLWMYGARPTLAADPLGIPPVPAEGAGRLGYFAEKVRSGVPVTIGYLGGSITQGTGASAFGNSYYWRSSRALLEAIKAAGGSETPKATLAAVGGTNSEYGSFRVGTQLLNPGVDLLIVEFAVNDGDNDAAVRGMEGIVRHAWRVNPQTAIVFLYTTAARSVEDFYMKDQAAPTVLRHHEVAKHYGIAEVHCGPTVASGIKQDQYSSKDFFPDSVHPSDLGHGVYAKLLLDALLPTLDWKAPAGDPPGLPAPILNDDLAYADWEKAEPSAKSGEWTETKPGYYTPVGGWKATAPASMTIPVKGKRIGLVFGTSTATVKISGLGFEKTFEGFKQNPPWVPKTLWVYEGEEQREGEIVLEVQPSAASETGFQIEGVKTVRRE